MREKIMFIPKFLDSRQIKVTKWAIENNFTIAHFVNSNCSSHLFCYTGQGMVEIKLSISLKVWKLSLGMGGWEVCHKGGGILW